MSTPSIDWSQYEDKAPAAPQIDWTKYEGISASQGAAAPQPQRMKRVMQQGIGGPPMYVDVPEDEAEGFEQAGKQGYQTGAEIGAGLVAGAGAGTASGALQAGGSAAKWMVTHPYVTAMGIHLARRLGIPIPRILDAISEFSGKE